jgi:hypothetical protein
MEKITKENNGQWSLVKSAPKGVDKDKWDRCVEQVEEKGNVESPHAVCSASLQKEERDSKMMFSNLQAVKHHAEELKESSDIRDDVPDWVDAKIVEVAKAMSDIAHYLEGRKQMNKAEEDDKQKKDKFGIKVSSGYAPKGELSSASRKETAESVTGAQIKQGKGALPKGGQKMSSSYSQKMNQLYDEGKASDSKSDKQSKNLSDAKKVLSQVKVNEAKNRTEEDKFKELRDQARRTVSAAKNAKYFNKPQKDQEVKVIRRRKENLAKSLDDLENKLKQYKEELSKSIDDNAEMMHSNIEQIVHHSKEIEENISVGDMIPSWVDAKMIEAAQNMSNVAHYMMGEKAKEELHGIPMHKAEGKPSDPKLYSRVKSEAKKKFSVWPSAYASAWTVKEYKSRGGRYRKD